MLKPFKFKKELALILIIAMISLSFISCGDENSSATDNKIPENITAGDTAESSAVEITTQPPKLEPDLPDMNFNGAIVNFLVKGEEYHWYWCSKEIYAEQENGEPVNDAVYKRNRYIEDKYNFEIKEYRSANPTGDASKTVKANDGTYDVFMLGLTDGANLAQNGYLVNLYSMPYINLSQPWWDQRAVKDLTIGNKLYCALGDINIMDNDATTVTFFNKKLIADNAMDNPYQLVRDGKWTLDKFNEIIIAISKDLNGDGVMDKNDLFGQLSESSAVYSFIVGAGGTITTNNSENYPELTINNEKTPAIIDKILINMGNRNLTLFADDYTSQYSNPWDGLTRPMFKNNQGLFYTIGMGTANLMRDMEIDFGILPLPKFDENQSGYYNPVSADSTTSVCIPVSGTKPECTGLAVEAMAAESVYTLTEAYYTINFENKSLRDEESIEMTKIILNSRSFDLGSMFNFGGIMAIFPPMAKKNANTFVSDYEKRADKAQAAIDKLIANFNK